MSFARPTLPELVARIQADFESRIDTEGSVLRKALVYVFARVWAGAQHMLHGHLEFLGLQLFPDRANDENLVRQAALYGMTKNDPAFASAVEIMTGTHNTLVPAGSVLARSDGAEYEVGTDSTITTLGPWVGATAFGKNSVIRNAGKVYTCKTGGTSAASGGPTGTDVNTPITDGSCVWQFVATGTAATIADVTAVKAGADGTLTDGVILTFQSPIAGADATTLTQRTTVDGTDLEETEAFRERFLEHLREPAHGGNEADIVAWAKEVSGVTRVWVYPLELGPGTVVVRFARDNDVSPIPDAGEVAALQAYLDARIPVHMALTVVAPVAAPLDVEVSGIDPAGAAMEAAIAAELADYIAREAEPGGTILFSQLNVTVGNTAELDDFEITDPPANVTHTTNQLPTLGTVSFV